MFESFRRQSLSSLMVCLSLACATTGRDAGRCPAIEMSVVADTQTDSTRSVTLNDTATILISRTSLVATGDVTGATASLTEGEWVLNFTVTDDAAKRVHEATTRNIGRNLALVVDGKVYGTPRIAAAIIGNGYRIGGFDQSHAEWMATAINRGCRP
jgi:preprotein translocase subunit SecD